jgi:hypothetical protein
MHGFTLHLDDGWECRIKNAHSAGAAKKENIFPHFKFHSTSFHATIYHPYRWEEAKTLHKQSISLLSEKANSCLSINMPHERIIN